MVFIVTSLSTFQDINEIAEILKKNSCISISVIGFSFFFLFIYLSSDWWSWLDVVNEIIRELLMRQKRQNKYSRKNKQQMKSEQIKQIHCVLSFYSIIYYILPLPFHRLDKWSIDYNIAFYISALLLSMHFNSINSYLYSNYTIYW